MSDVDDRTRARTFAQTVLNQLFAFSSEAFQRSVWIRGDHPERYVEDYAEAIATLCDFVPWLIDDEYYRWVPLTDQQIEELRNFTDLVDRVDDGLAVRDAEHALADPQWPAVRLAARRALDALERGDHGLRHQIEDP